MILCALLQSQEGNRLLFPVQPVSLQISLPKCLHLLVFAPFVSGSNIAWLEGEKQEGERGLLAAQERQALGFVLAHPPAQTLAKSHHRETVAFPQ